MAKPVEALLSHDTVFGAATAGFPALDQALVDRALHEAAAETHRLSEEFRHLRGDMYLVEIRHKPQHSIQ